VAANFERNHPHGITKCARDGKFHMQFHQKMKPKYTKEEGKIAKVKQVFFLPHF
jgi:hypothetical protein